MDRFAVTREELRFWLNLEDTDPLTKSNVNTPQNLRLIETKWRRVILGRIPRGYRLIDVSMRSRRFRKSVDLIFFNPDEE